MSDLRFVVGSSGHPLLALLRIAPAASSQYFRAVQLPTFSHLQTLGFGLRKPPPLPCLLSGQGEGLWFTLKEASDCFHP